MRAAQLTAIALLGLGTVAAHAQSLVPPAVAAAAAAQNAAAQNAAAQNAAAGGQPDVAAPPIARPGHEPGVGISLPLSDKASNIDPADASQAYAPTLPDAGLGDNAQPVAYLQVARDALTSGRTGQAQQALEMAETRMLDRSVVATRRADQIKGPRIEQISAAREALGRGDSAGAIRLIDRAMAR